MERTFRAEKMIKRLKAEGRGNLLTKEIVDKINALDGKKGNDYNYRSVVFGDPFVWIEAQEGLPDGEYVALCDCD